MKSAYNVSLTVSPPPPNKKETLLSIYYEL